MSKSVKLIYAQGYIYSDKYGIVSPTLGISIETGTNTYNLTKLLKKDGETYVALTNNDVINIFDMGIFVKQQSQNIYYGYNSPNAQNKPKYNEITLSSVVINFANQTFEIQKGDTESLNNLLFQQVWEIPNTNLEMLMDFEVKQDLLVACKNQVGRLKTWKVVELYHQPNPQNMLCKLVSITDEETMEIPWRAIKGMRNRIVHEYGDVEISIVYETVVSDLPVLLKQLQDIVL